MAERAKPPGASRRLDANGADGAHSRPQYNTKRWAGQAPDSLPVHNAQGRVVGHISQGWLVKRNLNPATHMAYRPRGWATDAAHLELPGVVGIRLHTTNGETWTATLKQFQEHGVAVNWGFGPQVVLPAEFWSVARPGEVEARQLALLGV